MEKQINLEYSTHFVIDYRSLPSGIGTIFYPSGDAILVTENDSGPRDMEEAKLKIIESALPSCINNIPFSMGEHWEAGQLALEAILKTHKTEYVIDSELAYEREDLVEDMGNHIFSLDNWIEARKI